MKIYPAKPGDIHLIQQLVHGTIQKVYPLYYPTSVVDFFLEHHSINTIKAALENEFILLAERNGEIVGTGSAKGNEIKRMFIIPEFQGLGIGTALLRALENHCLSQGYSAISLDASLPGYSLYEKMGFLPINYKKLETSDKHVLCYFEMEKKIL